MKLTQALSRTRLSDIKNLYLRAFPAAERKPFYMIRKKQAEGSMEILSIENDTGDFLGLDTVSRSISGCSVCNI